MVNKDEYYKRESVEVGVFRRGWVTFSCAKHRPISVGKVSPTNHLCSQKTRVIVLSSQVSYCIKISAVHCLVMSQSMRVRDGQTDGRTDGQNYDSHDRASIAARAIKTRRNQIFSSHACSLC